jgi:hypothetical protein
LNATAYRAMKKPPRVKPCTEHYQNMSGDSMKVIGKTIILIEIKLRHVETISCVVIEGMIVDVIIGNNVLRDRGLIDYKAEIARVKGHRVKILFERKQRGFVIRAVNAITLEPRTAQYLKVRVEGRH